MQNDRPTSTFSPKMCELDVTQWKRDISTFVVSTEKELSDISDQVSALLADPNADVASTRPRRDMRPADTSTGDGRLSRLKQQIAKRLS